jgi:transcriptional regulator with XRE-family HTH domain
MAELIDPKRLGARLRDRRLGLGLSVREAAEQAKVSAATFSRVERGDHLPDSGNLVKLARWAGVRLEEVTTDWAPRASRRKGKPASTPEAVAVHLRADRKLSPADASVLAEIFRSAYEALLKERKT